MVKLSATATNTAITLRKLLCFSPAPLQFMLASPKTSSSLVHCLQKCQAVWPGEVSGGGCAFYEGIDWL